MFRATLLVLFSLSALALASPSRLPRDGQCNGSTLCCDGASYRADSPEGLAVIASHGFDHTDYASDSSVHTSCGDFGLLGGSSCAQSPVCCEGNNIGNVNSERSLTLLVMFQASLASVSVAAPSSSRPRDALQDHRVRILGAAGPILWSGDHFARVVEYLDEVLELFAHAVEQDSSFPSSGRSRSYSALNTTAVVQMFTMIQFRVRDT
ncbi:predicted protein [Postia placenta Mad-698-R]|uniref:Uncharacterized protein n=1 Tax=Postia placenta MAD-698-R-SB12 TaxID=670580 RepID=A0A1X6N2S6_9APHY|nr:hypothetical protein POSPLADRAFT_1046291 [Postia placenta MAD-698-R-SB12]EED81991.1 predicted protein [Postia placenta Mad-698-R]OSX62918.1 hypothetical protein POSPLADRAFT_1046291 [Postia placenta MAD-698-R-SB12]